MTHAILRQLEDGAILGDDDERAASYPDKGKAGSNTSYGANDNVQVVKLPWLSNRT